MDNDKMMAAIMALPDADLMTESKLTDPIGSGVYYSAETVVRLLAAEREKYTKNFEPLAVEMAGNSVAIPQNADQAELMLKMAWMWLSAHAPERLRTKT